MSHVLAHGLQARRLHDPIEWLLSHAPAAWGNVSYAQYILQFIVYSLWPREFLTSWWELGLFFLFLLSCSYLTVEAVIAPLGALWHKVKPRTALAIACGASVVFASCCAIDKGVRVNAKPPPKVVLDPYVSITIDDDPQGAIDVKLNWTTAEGDFAEDRTLINPSLLWHGGRMRPNPNPNPNLNPNPDPIPHRHTLTLTRWAHAARGACSRDHV